MKLLRVLLFTVGLIVLAFIASPGLADCLPEDPNCPIEPPQSVEVDPNQRYSEGSLEDVSDPSALEPLKVEPPTFIEPVPLVPKRIESSTGNTRFENAGGGTQEANSEGRGTVSSASATSKALPWVMAAAAAGALAATSPIVLGRGLSPQFSGLGGRSGGFRLSHYGSGSGSAAGSRVGVARGQTSLGSFSEVAGSAGESTRTGTLGGGGDRRREEEDARLPRATWIPNSSTPTPPPTSTANSENAISPSTTPVPPTPTAIGFPTTQSPQDVPTEADAAPTDHPTTTPQSTASATLSPTSTPTPSNTPDASVTPTPYHAAWLASLTPGPTKTRVPSAMATQAARVKIVSTGSKDTLSFIDKIKGLFGGGSWPNNYQWTGAISGVLGGTRLFREGQGASPEELWRYKTAGKSIDSVGTYLMASLTRTQASLPTAGQALRSAIDSAAKQPGLENKITNLLSKLAQNTADELTAISTKVVPRFAKPLSWASAGARWLQTLGAAGGIIGGVFQLKDGVGMFGNKSRRDDGVGGVQVVGGIATTVGSIITGAAALGYLSSLPFVIGAAPVLLGVGAIAAVGTLVYNQLKDKDLDKKLENWSNKPGGFTETAIRVGRRLKTGLESWRGVFRNARTIAGTVSRRVRQGLSAWRGVANNTRTIITSVTTRMRDSIATSVDKAKDTVSFIAGGISSAIGSAIGKISNLFGRPKTGSETPARPQRNASRPTRSYSNRYRQTARRPRTPTNRGTRSRVYWRRAGRNTRRAPGQRRWR